MGRPGPGVGWLGGSAPVHGNSKGLSDIRLQVEMETMLDRGLLGVPALLCFSRAALPVRGDVGLFILRFETVRRQAEICLLS